MPSPGIFIWNGRRTVTNVFLPTELEGSGRDQKFKFIEIVWLDFFPIFFSLFNLIAALYNMKMYKESEKLDVLICII